MARRAGKALKKPAVGLLPELNIPGIEKWTSRSTTQQSTPDQATILREIEECSRNHDAIKGNALKKKAVALGIDRHRIDMADLADVSDETEGHLGHDPWLR